MIREVIIWPDPILSAKCEEVPVVDDAVRALLHDMEETMLACRGAGLAAPQVGFKLRLVTVLVRSETGAQVLKLVNPRIVKREEAPQLMKEGCLSLPGYYEQVRRNRHVTVESLDETGAKVEIGAEGLLAHALQHEIDHLDGITLTDHLSVIKRNLARAKFVKAKKKGMRWQAEKPEPKDFTDPTTKERPSRVPELLEQLAGPPKGP